MNNDATHDDGCRCMACYREKFKTIDPAAFGKAPALLPDPNAPTEER